jgi:hypothetical protein
MKRIASTVVLILAFTAGVGSNHLWELLRYWDTRRPPTGISQKVGPYWIYLNQVIGPVVPPNPVDDPIKAREDSVFIIFYPTGEFASIGCALYTADGVENNRIMTEDDFVVHRGIWTRNPDGTIKTTWRPSHGPGLKGEALKGERVVVFKPIGNVVSERGLLEGGGSSYVQIFDGEVENLEVLQRMIVPNNR